MNSWYGLQDEYLLMRKPIKVQMTCRVKTSVDSNSLVGRVCYDAFWDDLNTDGSKAFTFVGG